LGHCHFVESNRVKVDDLQPPVNLTDHFLHIFLHFLHLGQIFITLDRQKRYGIQIDIILEIEGLLLRTLSIQGSHNIVICHFDDFISLGIYFFNG